MEEDTIGAFLDECCIADDNAVSDGADIYQGYQTWCKVSGIDPKPRPTFYKATRPRIPKGHRQGWKQGRSQPHKRAKTGNRPAMLTLLTL
ncbi:MAG: primase-like DNA-binding domain-containing protein [Collinsella sp.]